MEDEAAEGVWGYLIPLDDKVGKTLVLRKRDSCQGPKNGAPKTRSGKGAQKQSKNSESRCEQNYPPGGYLIGRHPECGRCKDDPAWLRRDSS